MFEYETLEMKKDLLLLFCIGLSAIFSSNLLAQQGTQLGTIINSEEEEGPKLFKFEPDYLAAKEAQRKEILLKRALIDSMDISEGKRQKLVRDLYRNKDSKRLTKILLANNKFEESED